MATQNPFLRMQGITKAFPGILANDKVDFEVCSGEIHALLGENGAGKSTLMLILSGMYHPDAGSIILDGRPTVIPNPREAIDHGIGMVHQNFMLVDSYSVAENIILGTKALSFFLHPARYYKAIKELSQLYNLSIDPRAKIWQLSVGEQQRVEILKMLYRKVKLLILDEPTAVLTPEEVEELFRHLRVIAAQGTAIVFITHKMNEVMSISDRITVMRKGRKIGTFTTSQTTAAQLADLMLDIKMPSGTPELQPVTGKTVLELNNLQVMSDKGLPALKQLSLSLAQGEILGVAGVAGNGQKELAEVITGLRPASSGNVMFYGKNLLKLTVAEIIDAGVAYVPEDRKIHGSSTGLNLADNLMLKSYRRFPYCRNGMLNAKAARSHILALIKDFNLNPPEPDFQVRYLSGGNMQKLILARELALKPRLMIAAYPTRGLDLNATASVHRMLLQLKSQGCATLLISEDIDELIALADRLAVMYEGQIMGTMAVKEFNLQSLGLMMAGKSAN